MDHLDIKIFTAIMNAHSLSKASESLSMTQSAVSHRLKLLEKELEVQLISRRKGLRSIELTEQGLRFASLIGKWEEFYSEARRLKDTGSALPFTIAAPISLNNHLLPPFFEEFARNEKSLRLVIRSVHSTEVYQLVDRRQADAGLVFQEIRRAGILLRRVFSEKIYMLCRKGSYGSRRFLSPQDLPAERELPFSWSPAVQQWHDTWWGRDASPNVQADSPYLMSRFLRHGDYWALCPSSVARSLNTAEEFDIHEFTSAPPPRVCFMIRRQNLSEEQELAFETFLRAFEPYVRRAGI